MCARNGTKGWVGVRATIAIWAGESVPRFGVVTLGVVEAMLARSVGASWSAGVGCAAGMDVPVPGASGAGSGSGDGAGVSAPVIGVRSMKSCGPSCWGVGRRRDCWSLKAAMTA